MRNSRVVAILFAVSSVPLLCQSLPSGEAPVSYWHKVISPDTFPVWIGGIAAFLASIAAIITLVVLREQTKIGLLAAKTADEGAKAALLSAQAVMNAERAWIFAELGWYEGTSGRILLDTSVENGGPEMHSITINAKITYRNEGRSPAWIDGVYGRIDIASGRLEAKEYDRYECGNFGIVEPISASSEMSRSIEFVCNGRLGQEDYLSIYVIVDYHDIFNQPRETRLGYSLTLSGNLVRQNGLQGRNRNT